MGTTIVFDDAYTGAEKYGRIDGVYGNDHVVHVITKDEAGSNPRRVTMRRDARIAAITNSTGLIS
jgi:hypothetical protein